jgi:hypothetical protein
MTTGTVPAAAGNARWRERVSTLQTHRDRAIGVTRQCIGLPPKCPRNPKFRKMGVPPIDRHQSGPAIAAGEDHVPDVWMQRRP